MFATCPWLSYVVGYAIAALASLLVVRPTIERLWRVAVADLVKQNIPIPVTQNIRAAPGLRALHGVTEVWLYTSCIALGKPEGIAVWLGFKAVHRWKATDKEDPRHISGSLIYLIGTAMNVGFGVLGGWIATKRWSL